MRFLSSLVLSTLLFLMAVFLGFLTIPQSGWGAAVSVQARLEESTIYLGESVRLEVRITGLRNPALPTISHPDIDVTSEGGQSFNNSNISIINGRTTRDEEFGYIARYKLRPRMAGRLEIPPITITHAGQTYRSQPLTLQVRQPAEQDYLLVEVSADKPSYVLGERIVLSLDMSLRKLSMNGRWLDIDPFFSAQPPHLHIPWFAAFGDWKTDSLEDFVRPLLRQDRSGFYINNYFDQQGLFGRELLRFTLPRRSTRRQYPSGTLEYFTYRLQKGFRPIRAGVHTIPPVLVEATLPTALDARGRATHTERVVASGKPLTIEIRPVPHVGRPASFNGAVGRFRLTAKATPTHLKVGDPLTVTVTVHAEGDSLLETVRALRLQEQEALSGDFKIHPDPPIVNTTDHAKSFTYTLRPRHASVRRLPALEMASYDPEAKHFLVQQSDPIPLHVEPATFLKPSEVVASETSPTSTPGRQLAAGLLANYTGDDMLRPQQAELRFTPWLGGLLLFPPVAYVVTLLCRSMLRQRQRHPYLRRSKQAARTALAGLREVRKQIGTGADVFAGVQRTLVGYIRDRLHLPGAGLTVDDITQHLRTRGVQPDLVQQTADLLQLCDSARYAPGTLAVAQCTEVIDDAESVIRRLEGYLRL
jgi:hypothetical protein